MAILPLFDLTHLPDAAWLVDPPQPTGLLAGVPEAMEPGEVVQALADFIGDALEVQQLDPPPHQSWLAQVTIPGLSTPLLFFSAPRSEDDGLDVSLDDCSHLLGIEGLLHPADPLTVYVNLVRLLVAAAGTTSFAWDVVTNRVYEHEVLDTTYLGDGVEPADRVLWATEAVETTPGHWLVQTRGLHRCGRAELAVAGVPESKHQQALALVDGIASLSLEHPLPAPGKVIQVGLDLSVKIELAGSQGLSEHAADPTCLILDPVGEDASLVLDAMDGPEVAMYRTARAGARETRQARETWPTFAALCITSCESTDCLVQVPFVPPEDSDEDTHLLWLRVVSSDGNTVVAELLHAPPGTAGLKTGDRHDIDVDTVSNWCVMLPEGPHGPDSAAGITDKLRSA